MTTDLMTRPMQYMTKTGEEVKLTPQMVIEYLVRGKKELVNKQELIFFMHTCKARQLNPFVGDCYLVKYGQDPAAIITSRNYYEQTAMDHPRCQGWTNGIVVTKDGEITERDGTIVLEGETLVGGWAETFIKDWKIPKKWTVMLNGYIKKTRDGKVTKFWTEDKQPHMIAKVALVQLLREVYSGGAKNMYTPDEMPSIDTEPINMQPSSSGGGYEPESEEEEEKTQPAKTFEGQVLKLMAELRANHGYTGSNIDLLKFVGHTADVYKESQISIIDQALANPASFHVGLVRWKGPKDPAPDEKPDEPDLPWYHADKWKFLRGSGFTAFVIDNQDKITDIPYDIVCPYKGKSMYLRDALYAKWFELNPDQDFPGRLPPPDTAPEDAAGDQDPPEQPTETSAGEHDPNPDQTLRDNNINLRTGFYNEWLQARTELGFGGNVPMSEKAAEIWNVRISEIIDKNNQT